MHRLMLVADPQGFAETSIIHRAPTSVNGASSVSNSVLVIENLVQGWPFTGDLTVGMAFLGVFNIGINATLKNPSIGARLSGLFSESSRQMNVYLASA